MVCVCVSVFFTDSLSCASSVVVTHTLLYGVAGAGKYTYIVDLFPHDCRKAEPFIRNPLVPLPLPSSFLSHTHHSSPSLHFPSFRNHASLPTSILDSARSLLPRLHVLDSCAFSYSCSSPNRNAAAPHSPGRFGSLVWDRASYHHERHRWDKAGGSGPFRVGREWW